MKNSQDGTPVDPGNPSGNEWLLNGETASDVCLSCHSDKFGAVLGGDPTNPPPEKGAGNFVFLFEDNINDAPDGMTNQLAGHAAGHSIVAPAYGLFPDPEWSTAPGGDYPAADLGCTSCHDPHGNGNFRMLYGAGPIQEGSFTFLYPAPTAAGIDLLTGVESQTSHSAYHNGMSQWCSNCHGEYHDAISLGSFEHRFNHPLSARYAGEYNSYNGTADPDGGAQATAYLPQVPFEEPTMQTSSTSGPFPSSRTNCLTCHRAHASSAPRATRWDTRVTTLGQDGVVSGSYALPNPYADPAQEQLCRKCHETDPNDQGPVAAPLTSPSD